MIKIAIIDYEMGNRRSVEKALARVGSEFEAESGEGVQVEITAVREEILDADGAVIVGVGAFPEAVRRLKDSGLFEVLRERYELGRPILGICLGLQLFFEHSDEHEGADGLGFLDGRIEKIPANGLKVPHIGWNQVTWSDDSRLAAGVDEEDSTFYHLHSYAAFDADRPEVVGTTDYSRQLVTAVEDPPLYGVQFHPEKSSHQGLRLLRNFVEICAETRVVA